jgi:hypothetical protein
VQIQIAIGHELQKTVAELTDAGRAMHGAINAGLADAGELAAGNVIATKLRGQSLKMRSGLLAKHVTSWQSGDLQVTVGVPDDSPVEKYKWQLGDEQFTILPVKGRYLTIPIGENLTPTGVPRYSSPRQKTDGFFIRTGGKLLFGYKVGKKGKFRPLLALVTSVQAQGTGALIDGVLESQDDMAAAIQDQVDKVTA